MSQTTLQTPLIEFDKVQALYGAPYAYKDICLVYSLTLKEIAQMGTNEFYKLLQIITIHPPTISKRMANVTPLEYLLDQSKDPIFAQEFKKAIYAFTKEECLIIPEASIFAFAGQVGDEEKFFPISADDFAQIQNAIRQLHWLELVRAAGNQTSDKAQQILDKIARGKQIVQQVKNKGPASDSNIGLADMIASAAIAIPGLNPMNIWDMTYYSFYDTFQRYQRKEHFETSMRAAMAGAKIPKKELEGWIRPITL